MTDEEQQGRIERGLRTEDRDSRAYIKIFEGLRREPEFVLPSNFSENVVYRLKLTASLSSRDMIWFYSGLAACLVAMIVSVLMTDFRINFGAFRFISGYPGLVIFAILFVLALQWVDRKIVRRTP